jgi:protein-disulfide isomerase
MGMNVKSVGLVVTLLASLSEALGTCQKSNPQGEVVKDKPEIADVKVEGVDTSSLTAREKKEFSTYVSELLSPCSSVPVPIAQCVNEKRACAKCLPAAKYVLKGVRDGMTREQVEKAYKNRFDAERVKNVALDGSPSKGPDAAPIVMVEFADFECPHCGLMAPLLDKAWDEHKSNVKFVYKFLPLSGHVHAEPAARAAIAAMNQGKFWEMHQKIYANQQHLEQGDLDLYAKDLGLDIGKFKADMIAPATKERLDRDRKQADALEVKGTPTIYINGREYDMKTELGEWFSQELASMGGALAPVAAPTDAGALLLLKGDGGRAQGNGKVPGPHK